MTHRRPLGLGPTAADRAALAAAPQPADPWVRDADGQLLDTRQFPERLAAFVGGEMVQMSPVEIEQAIERVRELDAERRTTGRRPLVPPVPTPPPATG